MLDFFIFVFFGNFFREWFVVFIVYKWCRNCIGDLGRKKYVFSICCRDFNYFVEEDNKVSKLSLNVEVIKYMIDIII